MSYFLHRLESVTSIYEIAKLSPVTLSTSNRIPVDQSIYLMSIPQHCEVELNRVSRRGYMKSKSQIFSLKSQKVKNIKRALKGHYMNTCSKLKEKRIKKVQTPQPISTLPLALRGKSNTEHNFTCICHSTQRKLNSIFFTQFK